MSFFAFSQVPTFVMFSLAFSLKITNTLNSSRLNILVPTDFSPKSVNALRYALALAQYYPADIHLLHAYHVPITLGVSVYPMDEDLLRIAEEEAKEKLKELMAKELPALKTSQIHTRLGFAVDEIENFAQSQGIDLIVMGARGGGAQEAIWGSTATTLMQRSSLPLILVPENAAFRGFFNIAFACDGGQLAAQTLSYLKFFAAKSDAIIHCVSVQEKVADMSKPEVVKQIEKAFPGHMHHFCISQHSQLEEALQDFVHQHNIDLLVMTPRRHDFWTQLFKGSSTKKMAFKTDTPLFVLKEQEV